MTEQQDEIIQAQREMISELLTKIISLRVDAGLKLKEKDAEIERLKNGK